MLTAGGRSRFPPGAFIPGGVVAGERGQLYYLPLPFLAGGGFFAPFFAAGGNGIPPLAGGYGAFPFAGGGAFLPLAFCGVFAATSIPSVVVYILEKRLK